jgi:ribonuclease BN (tRNA processing enzyme)
MKLTVLGSGTTVPHPRRTSAALWLETSGGRILLDCAATSAHRLAACGVDWPNLDAIWISHFHMDHCGGLGPLLTGLKHAEETKERARPLTIFGPVGIRELIDNFSGVHDYKLLEQKFPVSVVEVEELKPFEIAPNIEAVAMETPHRPESLAIHIRDSEKAFVYTSDTGFDEKTASLGNGVDLLAMECTFLKDKTDKKHLELAEAMFLVRKARPKKALFLHLNPGWDEVNFNEEVAKFDPPCEIIESMDGLVVQI